MESNEKAKEKKEHIVKAGFHEQRLLHLSSSRSLSMSGRGFFIVDLAMRFNVSQATVSRTCITWASYLILCLAHYQYGPGEGLYLN